MTGAGKLHALFLTAEEPLLNRFGAVCQELGITTEAESQSAAISRLLNNQKYHTVVVDFDNIEFAQKCLAAVQESGINKNAVLVAIATTRRSMDVAFDGRAHFVLKRPLQDSEISRTLHAAYDLMLRDRRRHFRCSVVLPVRLTMIRSGARIECTTINVSANGMAVYTSTVLKPADMVDIELVLPDGFATRASGIVVWDNGRGQCGLHFQCSRPEVRHKLDAWLSAQVAGGIPVSPSIQ